MNLCPLKWATAAVLIPLWAAAGSPAQAASIVDTFSDGPGVIQTDRAPFVEAWLPAATAPGGGRYIANSIGAGVAQAGKFTFAAVQSGAYFTLSDPAIALYTNLTYGPANGFGRELSLDLRSESAFKLDFRYLSAPVTFSVSVVTLHGTNPASVADFPIVVNASSAQSVIIPFSAFVNDRFNPSPVNWGDIDSITFIATGPGGSGFALDHFSTVQAVPEPTTWALLMAGLVGVAVVARRRGGAQ
jgi:hypothetical protein